MSLQKIRADKSPQVARTLAGLFEPVEDQADVEKSVAALGPC